MTPASAEDLATALRDIDHRPVVPWGAGMLQHLGAAPPPDALRLCTAALDQVLEYNPPDLTISVQAGVALAKEMGASVTGFFAVEPPPTHLYGNGYLSERDVVKELQRRAREIAQKSVDEISAAAKAAGVPCDTVVSISVAPHQAIIDTAEKTKCDAVFMASHGHRGLTGLLLGSVTQKVLTHSKIPVLVFR